MNRRMIHLFGRRALVVFGAVVVVLALLAGSLAIDAHHDTDDQSVGWRACWFDGSCRVGGVGGGIGGGGGGSW